MSVKAKENIVLSIIIICIMSTVFIILKDNNKINKQKPSNEIAYVNKIELQTSEYFDNIPENDKYYINSIDELNYFYSLYSNKLSIDDKYLDENTILVQVKQVGSGSISFKLKSISVKDNKIHFDIERNEPEIGTCDMAFWYLGAIVPNDELEGVDLSEWHRPSEFITNN